MFTFNDVQVCCVDDPSECAMEKMTREKSRVELLAPAGDLACLGAAIENGADAVYFGLDRGFNARARAANISLANLPETMETLHRRQVKGYVTLNTLVFSGELVEFTRIVRDIANAGVDAVLVQDLGAARLVNRLCPGLAVHASTQMTMTSAECIAAIEQWGIQRVVLARELSLAEIRQVADRSSLELEVFAHGALCVAYSGQCLTSESLGGRSANRGQCAQACRLPYDVYCDGKEVDLGRVKYLLSPQDLAAHDHIPDLIDAGVSSLKIEGRLKSPEYVASVTAHYRSAIDQALVGRRARMTPSQREEMELTFSRGFSPGWLEGCDHKRLVPGISSAKRGVRVGTVSDVAKEAIQIQLSGRIAAGDGVMFDVGREQNLQPGGRIFQIWQSGDRVDGSIDSGCVELRFRSGTIQYELISRGIEVWKTDDPRITRRLRKQIDVTVPRRKMQLSVDAFARIGQPLRLRASLPEGVVVELESDEPLQIAKKHPLTQQVLQRQLGRIGNSPFELAALNLDVDECPMVPLSVIGKLRHRMVQLLEVRLQQQAATPIDLVADSVDRSGATVLGELRPSREGVADDSERPRLHVLCRTLGQLESVLGSSLVSEVSVDFADIRQYAEAIRMNKLSSATQLWLATPRIHKPGENGVFLSMKKQGEAGWLARNLAAMRFCQENGIRFIADYSLNVANEISARSISESGACRLTTSYDLNRDQLRELVSATPSGWLEVVIHQHMPMFHMEHCVFCAVLSPGTNKTNCGRPCDDHIVHMKDRVGMKHLLTADVGCRNTLYNATPQSAAEVVPDLIQQGVRWFRIELLEEDDDVQIQEMVDVYAQLLAGDVTGHHVWTKLNAINRVGVTRGTLEAARDPLAIL